VVLFEITKFANTPRVARTISVLAVSAHLTSSDAVVALVTLSFRVERFVRVRAIRNLPLA